MWEDVSSINVLLVFKLVVNIRILSCAMLWVLMHILLNKPCVKGWYIKYNKENNTYKKTVIQYMHITIYLMTSVPPPKMLAPEQFVLKQLTPEHNIDFSHQREGNFRGI